MKKDVCSLYEHGVYYNIYEIDGYYVRENINTGDAEYISYDEYNLYRLASFLNDQILAKKGIINDYYTEENAEDTDALEEEIHREDNDLASTNALDSANLEDAEELDLINAVKSSVDESTDSSIDDDERTLRELEAIIEERIHKSAENGGTRTPEVIEEDQTILPNQDDFDEFEFLGLSGEYDFDEEEIFDKDGEFIFSENTSNKKKGLFHKVKKTRKPRVKREKVKKEKLPKEKKEKAPKEKKESFFHKVIKTRKPKVKREKVKKEKLPKEKKEKVPKEKKENIFHKVIKTRKPKVKREKAKREKQPKEHKVKSARTYSSKSDKVCRRLTIFAAVALGLALATSVGYKAYKNYKANSPITFEFNEEENRMDTIKKAFADIMESNKTIDESVKRQLNSYLDTLYSYELSDEFYGLILNNLNKMDFTDVSSIGVSDLDTLLEGNKNSIVIAYELYNYKNDISYLNITKYQWIADVLSFSDEATNLFLEGKDINDILKAAFGIDETINVESTTIADGECNNIKAFIEKLKSTGFASINPCEFENNIFNSYIKVYDGNTKCYLYFDKTTRKGISTLVYRQNLSVMLDSRVDELDYSNVKDRELLYFYANALLDSNNMESTDMTDLIMNGVNSSYSVFDIFDLMRYMSGSEVNHIKAAYLYGLITYGEDALPLLQEINMCLKMDVEDGLIAQETYDAFLHHLNLGIDAYAPHMKDVFNEASEKNEHMNGYELKLFGGYDI